MKKLFTLVAAIFIYAASASASNGYEFMLKLDEKTTFSAIARYIEADFEQQSQLKEMFKDTSKKMADAISENNDAAVEKALYFNLANAKKILSDTQYRKYLTMLNVTYQNKQYELLANK